jgi:hypothetical protein
MATIFSMVFILIFMLFFGFAIFKNTYKNGKVKYKKKALKLCLASERKVFYFFAANFFCYETQNLLNSCTRIFAKLVDDILCKVRLLAPKCDLTSQEIELKRNKIGDRAVYVLDNNAIERDFSAVCLALCIEEFFPIYLGNKSKEVLQKYPKINHYKNPSKEFVLLCKKLNINLNLPKPIECYFLKENFNFKQKFKKHMILGDSYLLTQYKSQDFKINIYNFFVKGSISLCFCENLTDVDKNFEFKFFYDLANQRLNYFDISKRNNFVIIKDEIKQDITYLNFSLPPKQLNFSCLKNTIKSNLPCVELTYKQVIKPKERLQFVFMLSKNPQLLENLDTKKISEISKNNINNFFDFNILFSSKTENDFFNNEIINQAKAIYLGFGKKRFHAVGGDYNVLKNKYLAKEIDELCFFVSVKSNLISYEKTGVKINPYFVKDDFKIRLLAFKNPICIVRKNLKAPCLVLDGVKYFNHLLVQYDMLANYEAKIEC